MTGRGPVLDAIAERSSQLDQVSAETRGRLRAMIDENQGKARYQVLTRQAAEAALALLDRHEATRGAELREQARVLMEAYDAERARTDEARAETERVRAATSPPKMVARVDGTGSNLKFPCPRDENGTGRPFHLADLEALAVDLRTAGGKDTTAVRFNANEAEARVEFPEFVATGGSAYARSVEAATEAKPERRVETHDARLQARMNRLLARWAATMLGVFVFAFMLGLWLGSVQWTGAPA